MFLLCWIISNNFGCEGPLDAYYIFWCSTEVRSKATNVKYTEEPTVYERLRLLFLISNIEYARDL
jgi:hypothetical protein